MIARRNIKLYNGEIQDIIRFIFQNPILDGEHISLFEKEFAKYIGVKYAVATSTARQGYLLILKSLNIPKKSEILLPAYTIKGLIEITRKAGYIPRTVDINPDTLNIEPDEIRIKITPKTKAVIATHIFGAPCELDKIRKICLEKSINLIEDCAHATGAMYKNKKVGSFGIANFFSFETIKPINTFRGGMVTTNDEVLYNRLIKERKKHKFPSRFKLLVYISSKLIEQLVLSTFLFYLFVPLFCSDFLKESFNKLYKLRGKIRNFDYRLTNLQSYLGVKQLKIIDKRNLVHNNNSIYLINKIKLENQKILPRTKSTYYFLVFKCKRESRKLQKELLLKGIDTSTENELADRCNRLTKDIANNLEGVYNQIIQVPCYEGLDKKDLDKIIKEINKFVG